MDLTDQLFSEGKLTHLEGSSRTVEGVNRIVHFTQGRFSRTALAAVTGQQELPIISAKCKLAQLIARGAHKGESGTNHREIQDCIARTREVAFIFKPKWLVWQIIDSCPLYSIKKAKKAAQLIGKLPEDKVQPSPPFSMVSVDLVGHYWVKPTIGSKATIKVWILIYLCDVSKALHTEVLETCSGPGMVNALRTVFAIRNTPHKISADPRKNFINAKNRMTSAGGSPISKKDFQEV